jgi:hypothetical protein
MTPDKENDAREEISSVERVRDVYAYLVDSAYLATLSLSRKTLTHKLKRPGPKGSGNERHKVGDGGCSLK